MKKLSQFAPILAIIFAIIIFFYPYFLKNSLPIPSDTIIGLYYPFRDLYVKTNPNGIAYKNFLITDPVRQQYPWKNLAISFEKNLRIPLWNPYEMAGTPLLANFQSSPFYPLNILLFINPFFQSWSLFIFLQPILGGLFLYFYLKNLKLGKLSSLLGALTWALCGFSVAWMEWGVIIHTALWLPLILLATDKIASYERHYVSGINAKILWGVIYVFSMVSSFYAGHLQTFFYLFVFSSIYFLLKIFRNKNIFNLLKIYAIITVLFVILSLPQLLPTLQFILLSNRSLDQSFSQPGWFIPYQNLAQFIAPDFFGNPATLNYFGVWNYAEFIGYVGIVPLILALYAALTRHDKKTWFFLCALLAALLFALPNLLSQLPFLLKIPFISTAQPTRLIFIIDFCLSVLSALGLDYLLKMKTKIWIPVLIFGLCLGALWVAVSTAKELFPAPSDFIISKNNLKLPSILFGLSAVLLLGFEFTKNKRVRELLTVILLIVVLADLLRFGWKFTPFTNKDYLFPNTQVTQFLQKQPGVFRIASTDNRILPPNFSVMYHLQSIEGYDPLYLNSYAEFIAASQRSDHSIKPPFGFNRIITPRNLDTQAIDFLNVKYVLALSNLSSPKFKKIQQFGQTRIYENTRVFPRVYFVKKTITVPNNTEAAARIFENDLALTAVVTNTKQIPLNFSVGQAAITEYSSNKVVIKTSNDGMGFLVFSDTNYPFFHATIDGAAAKTLSVNIAFRGLVVPGGKHIIIFEPKLF